MRVEHMTFNYPTDEDALEAFQLFIVRNFSDLIEFYSDTGTGVGREIKLEIPSVDVLFGVKYSHLRILNTDGQVIYTTNINIRNETFQAINFDGQIALMSGSNAILMTVKLDDGTPAIFSSSSLIYHGHIYSTEEDSGLNMSNRTRLGAIYSTQVNRTIKNTFSISGALAPSYPVYMRLGDELLITAGTDYAIHQLNKGGF